LTSSVNGSSAALRAATCSSSSTRARNAPTIIPTAVIVPTPTTLVAAGYGAFVTMVANTNSAAAQAICRAARVGARKWKECTTSQT
jgi:hypothetical protein